jgi:hypothetical protein
VTLKANAAPVQIPAIPIAVEIADVVAVAGIASKNGAFLGKSGASELNSWAVFISNIS